MRAALALHAVSLRYGRTRVLDGLTLAVAEGSVLALLGPSGSGKTSVMRLLLGLSRPDAGQVLVGGELVTDGARLVRPPEERQLAAVFQDLALWPHLTVQGNLAFGLAARGLPRAEREARIDAMLGRVDLRHHARRYPGELSGGERQRVAVARALVLEPRAVLLDEPVSTLDVVLKAELLALFRELFAQLHATVLYVTHDPREALALADEAAILEEGRLVQQGPLEELRGRPASPFVERLMSTVGAPTPCG